jgi:hypothetical protein
MQNSIWLHKNRMVLINILVSVFLALGSCFSLHEDDMFWQIRAGSEIVKEHRIQNTDIWSYTVQGEKWVNFEWLSEVSFYLVHRTAGIAGLVVARACLIFFMFFMMATTMTYKLRDGGSSETLLLLLLLPVSYVACRFRLHLRPEIFCIALFSLQMFLWVYGKKLFWQVPIVLLAANFHAGSAVFNLLLAVSVIFFGATRADIKKRSMYGAACVISFFLTPIHFQVIGQLLVHSGYDINLFFNKDWLPFSFGLLNVKQQGWTFVCWFFILLSGLVSVFSLKRSVDGWIYWVLGILLAVLCFRYIRSIPYGILFLCPVIIDGGRKLIGHNKKLVRLLIALVVFVWLIIIPRHVFKYYQRLGLSVNDELFPVTITKFIAQNRPQPRIFADPESSSYMLLFVPQYQSYIDHRDVVFNSIKPELRQAQQDPKAMQELLNRYGVNTIVNTYSKGGVSPNGEINDPIGLFYPKKDWALVYFTNQYIMLLRRIPQHKGLIEKFEYKVLNPSLPATVFAFAKTAVDFSKETERCLKDEPYNFFCNTLIAAEKIKTHNREDIMEAIKILELIEKRLPLNDYRPDITHYSLKWRAYSLLGDNVKAAGLESAIMEMTGQ